MLILKAEGKVNWKWIYSKLLYGVVNESRVWSNEVIDEICNMWVIIKRRRHRKLVFDDINEI